ncbi:hypothetical protein QLS71_005345 [Mariniflexile litorale]|uniref:Uncharacterized protein n=1 Tax=Mariniflexile litorale TaxID=3045158 RepID=A0AAU7EKI5_9FLAO|nr:hypothetical protein [Mariniflexile sp. KMM 9835]MDQ8211000.1 hypothetical protein [Mariniflexile sp. KMM 9835]
MKLLTVLLYLGLVVSAQAQEVSFNGITYKIKGKTILLDKADVTTTLSVKDQKGVWEAFNKQKALDEERMEASKALKKAEKEQKKAEKKQKKAEKELKAKEKVRSKFEDVSEDYEDAVAKFEKLKKKGKLSPNDETKWLKKIQNLKDDVDKTKRKL